MRRSSFGYGCCCIQQAAQRSRRTHCDRRHLKEMTVRPLTQADYDQLSALESVFDTIGKPVEPNDAREEDKRLREIAGKSRRQISNPYLSLDCILDLLAEQLRLLIKSPMGSGKSELIRQLIEKFITLMGRQPRVLVAVNRTTLAIDVATRFGFECYKDVPAEYISSVPQLTICLNSMRKLRGQDGKIAPYDIVILEESDQLLSHVTGGTFTGNQGIFALRILAWVVRQAKWVVALDAHATRLSYEWLQSMGSEIPVYLLENVYQPRLKPTLYRYTNHNVLLTEAEAMIQAQFEKYQQGEPFEPVVVSFTSRAQAGAFNELLSKRYGDLGVLVTGENSKLPETQAFISNINQRLPEVLWLIHTHAIGTGVDIQTPVAAAFGVFGDRMLPAPELMQMIARCRHAQTYHVAIKHAERDLPTDEEDLYKRQVKKLERASELYLVLEDGTMPIDPAQQKMAQLQARVTSLRNASFNELIGHFLYLARQCFRVERVREGVDHIGKEFRQTQEALAEAKKGAVFGASSIAPDEQQDYLANYPQRAAVGAVQEGEQYQYIRCQIEYHYGVLTEETYSDYDDGKGLEYLARYRDLFTPQEVLEKEDQQQVREGHALHVMEYRAVRARIVDQALTVLFGKAETGYGGTAVEEEQVIEQIERVKTQNGADLNLFFGIRSDASQNPLPLLRRLLKQVGLRLQSARHMRQGERTQQYALDEFRCQQMERYRKHQERREQGQKR
jgi:hypothetical protein